MSIHSFLLEMIKLLVTISIGAVTLALAFADKLKLDFANKETRTALYSLWISFIISLISYIGFGFFIYDDIALAAMDNHILRFSIPAKTFLAMALLCFGAIIFFLTRIGKIVIQNNSSAPTQTPQA